MGQVTLYFPPPFQIEQTDKSENVSRLKTSSSLVFHFITESSRKYIGPDHKYIGGIRDDSRVID